MTAQDWMNESGNHPTNALKAPLLATEYRERAEWLASECARLEAALRELLDVIHRAQKGSIGAINNVYLPQLDVAFIDKVDAALEGKP